MVGCTLGYGISSTPIEGRSIKLARSNIDIDAHYFALAALAEIREGTGDPEILKYLLDRRLSETDGDLIERIDDVTSNR